MPDWVTVAPADAVTEGKMIPVAIGGHNLAIYCVGGKYYATDNLCTHGLSLLTDGFLEGLEIECPLHGGRFDINTGKGLGEPITCDIRSYSVRVADAQIQVQIDTAASMDAKT
jgi:naphthalene 1,2-dioxygenase system ferredoxin subunit